MSDERGSIEIKGGPTQVAATIGEEGGKLTLTLDFPETRVSFSMPPAEAFRLGVGLIEGAKAIGGADGQV